MFFVTDIETTKNFKAELYFEKKDYGVVPSRDELGDPPAAISKIKTQELRLEKLNKWQEDKIAKVHADIAAKRAKDIDQAALKWWLARIVCIGIEPLDYEGNSHGVWTFHGDDEKKILCEFFDLINRFSESHEIKIIGKQMKDFDMPMIIGRAMALNIGLPKMFHVKTNEVNDFFGYSKTMGMHGKLNDYAWGCGLSPKIAKGTDVFGWVEAGLWDKITEYCADDVRITAELVRRFYKLYIKENVDA